MLGAEAVGKGKRPGHSAGHGAAPPPDLPGHAGSSNFSSAPLPAYCPEDLKGLVQSISYLTQWQRFSVGIALSITACAEGAGGLEGCPGALGFGTAAGAAWPDQAV